MLVFHSNRSFLTIALRSSVPHKVEQTKCWSSFVGIAHYAINLVLLFWLTVKMIFCLYIIHNVHITKWECFMFRVLWQALNFFLSPWLSSFLKQPNSFAWELIRSIWWIDMFVLILYNKHFIDFLDCFDRGDPVMSVHANIVVNTIDTFLLIHLISFLPISFNRVYERLREPKVFYVPHNHVIQISDCSLPFKR